MTKDTRGTEIKEGDRVHVKLADLWNQGLITLIKPGGSVVEMTKEGARISTGEVHIQITAVAHFDPRTNQVGDLFKLQEVKPNVPDTDS